MLVEQGFVESRHQAQALILSGKVKAGGLTVTKAGTLLPEEASLEVTQPNRYVGRGGIKLEHALGVFQISPEGKKCLDVGASTGGFTDCLLQHGAAKVYAVDVGRGQLAWKLRQDSRVICLEKVNARFLSREEINEEVSLAVLDVSFISVKKILPALPPLMKPEGEIVVLIKPQFEASPKEAKKGIVKDEKIHQRILADFMEWCMTHEFSLQNLTFSPITGAEGNLEFFVFLRMSGASLSLDAAKTVREAHALVRKLP